MFLTFTASLEAARDREQHRVVAIATVGNDVRLVQCDSVLQLAWG